MATGISKANARRSSHYAKAYDIQTSRTRRNTIKQRERHVKKHPNDKAAQAALEQAYHIDPPKAAKPKPI